MHFPQDILSVLGTVPIPQLGFNWLDIIIFVVFVVYAIEGYAMGFLASLFDLISFILSFFIGLRFYSFLGQLFVQYFQTPPGFANAIGFFVVAFISEVILNIAFRYLLVQLLRKYQDRLSLVGVSNVNKILGILPGLLSAFIILSFLLTIVISLPLSPFLKKAISSSKLGNPMVAHAQVFENSVNAVFGGAIKDTLDFLTVEPQSNESISLNFKTTNVSPDSQSEGYMLSLVNKERTSKGLEPLVMDDSLRPLARAHSQDMFARGYFSHYTPEGLSPFDRMAKANITYAYAGENLAFAPNTDLAMQGLMNSPGHRANILSPNFKKVGIGIIDGGVYGEMFSQEFTD